MAVERRDGRRFVGALAVVLLLVVLGELDVLLGGPDAAGRVPPVGAGATRLRRDVEGAIKAGRKAGLHSEGMIDEVRSALEPSALR